MTRKLLILGAGGHGQVLADLFNSVSGDENRIVPIGFLDDDVSIAHEVRCGIPVLGSLADISKIEHDAIIIGIGNNQIRSRLFSKLLLSGERFATAIHRSAVIGCGVEIGNGSVICAGVIVSTGSTIGENVIVNTSSSVDHHSQIGNHTHIAPGVHLGGYVKVEDHTLVGIGATVLPNIRIGANCIVGAGAVINRNVPDNVLAKGIPARYTHNQDK